MSTAIKERPVLFSGPMVRAILEGRKTQTRRIIKPQPKHRLIEGLAHVTVGMNPDDDGAVWYDSDCINPGREVRCPYGRIGDRLRISEEVTVTAIGWGRYQCKYAADNSVVIRNASPDLYAKIRGYKRPRLRGVNLPAAYARDVRLEITGVRVEQLGDITESDAIAEGAIDQESLDEGYSAVGFFNSLWARINGDFDRRTWVWVVEFKRLEASP